jgi:hypothetical protein
MSVERSAIRSPALTGVHRSFYHTEELRAAVAHGGQFSSRSSDRKNCAEPEIKAREASQGLQKP